MATNEFVVLLGMEMGGWIKRTKHGTCWPTVDGFCTTTRGKIRLALSFRCVPNQKRFDLRQFYQQTHHSSLCTCPGWWFGSFFHILGIIIPIDSYFSEGFKPPTSINHSKPFSSLTNHQLANHINCIIHINHLLHMIFIISQSPISQSFMNHNMQWLSMSVHTPINLNFTNKLPIIWVN